ncbi:hypothetical protein FXW78_26385 [Rhodococcus opacus]|nr:hypothetical protein [Rhodococcus opacus]
MARAGLVSVRAGGGVALAIGLDLALRICEIFGLPVEAVCSRSEFAPLSTELYGCTRPPDPGTSTRHRGDPR